MPSVKGYIGRFGWSDGLIIVGLGFGLVMMVKTGDPWHFCTAIVGVICGGASFAAWRQERAEA